MTYEELLRTTPAELYRMQLHSQRKLERQWEKDRIIIASIINGYSKRKVKPRDVIQLELDKKRVGIEITKEEIDKTLKAWGLN